MITKSNNSIKDSKLFIDLLQNLTTDNLDGYIFISSDEYQNEYIADHDNRIKYLTGFSGSFALVIILRNEGYFFTDGRYITQAQKQLDIDYFKIHNITELAKFNWTQAIKNLRIGYDTKIFIKSTLKYFQDLNLIGSSRNLFDQVWYNRPIPSNKEAFLYPIEYSGEEYASKLSRLQEFIKHKSAETILLTSSESICWLLNIRGYDLEFCPLLNCYALVHLNKVEIFTNLDKISKDLYKHFDHIEFHSLEMLESKLANVKEKILLDEKSTSIHILSLLDKVKVENIPDPCLSMRSIKNDVEVAASIQNHIYDAKAICEAIAKLKLQLDQGLIVSEFDVSGMLALERSKTKGYLCESFAAICGYQDNAAIMHYRAEKDHPNTKILQKKGLFLIDSGGHYLGATTDVTRTIALGEVRQQQRIIYTNVLKGHIALAKCIFPKGITGSNIDACARQFLWQHGYDYAHGTGHGVGNAMNVHEGPHAINGRNTEILKENMIISNEPGFYLPNDFGIRIENLIYITKSSHANFLCFKNLTLLPYDKKLIKLEMLNEGEIDYIKQYYKHIENEVKPLLSEEAKEWLSEEISLFA